ncbi:MAG: DEAD/DEAH box helicase [Shimia sp.]
MDFDMLGLAPALAARLDALGLTDPTPIQRKAIPPAMEGRDIMGLAQTGTGKTAAFGLPILDRLLAAPRRPEAKTTRALILAPTRELAKQISESLKAFAEGERIRILLVTGGAGIGGQINRLDRGCDVLVATPGRLLDLMDRRAVRLDRAEVLVLDEADQMLDLGFIEPLKRIARHLPEERQTLLFSATMPKQMNELAQTYLTDPLRIEVAPPGKTADKIVQGVHFLEQADKPALLAELLGAHPGERAIVFARTKHGAERLMKGLVAQGFAAAAVHGNKTQGQRDRAIAGFKSGDILVLVATDVAARGLDIPDVKVVYNFDLPNVPDSYVHRIGRTARAGKEGRAVAFCAPDEAGYLRAIEKVIGLRVPVLGGTPWAPHEEQEPKKRGGGGGRRRGGGARPQGGPRGSGGGGKPSQGGKAKPGGGRGRGGKPGNRSSRRRAA